MPLKLLLQHCRRRNRHGRKFLPDFHDCYFLGFHFQWQLLNYRKAEDWDFVGKQSKLVFQSSAVQQQTITYKRIHSFLIFSQFSWHKSSIKNWNFKFIVDRIFCFCFELSAALHFALADALGFGLDDMLVSFLRERERVLSPRSTRFPLVLKTLRQNGKSQKKCIKDKHKEMVMLMKSFDFWKWNFYVAQRQSFQLKAVVVEKVRKTLGNVPCLIPTGTQPKVERSYFSNPNCEIFVWKTSSSRCACPSVVTKHRC